MTSNTFRFLSAAQVRLLLKMPEAIEAMHQAFGILSTGKAEVPLRMSLPMKKGGGGFLFMPVYLPENNLAAIKNISIVEDNPGRGLPVINALVILINAENGLPLAIMDAESLTAIRTGAASGLATDLLAKKDAKSVAIIGAGAQGKTQLEAVLAVREIERVVIIDNQNDVAEQFAELVKSEYQLEVTARIDSSIVQEVDIICTATSSKRPVLLNKHIQAGTHINAVGAYKPDMQEIPADTIIRSRLYVDSKPACLSEPGDILIPLKNGAMRENHIIGEIGQLCSGSVKGRTSDSQITLFKSVGNAVQDIFAAKEIYDKAIQKNVGTILEL